MSYFSSRLFFEGLLPKAPIVIVWRSDELRISLSGYIKRKIFSFIQEAKFYEPLDMIFNPLYLLRFSHTFFFYALDVFI